MSRRRKSFAGLAVLAAFAAGAVLLIAPWRDPPAAQTPTGPVYTASVPARAPESGTEPWSWRPDQLEPAERARAEAVGAASAAHAPRTAALAAYARGAAIWAQVEIAERTAGASIEAGLP